jgi:hypothetical protein
LKQRVELVQRRNGRTKDDAEIILKPLVGSRAVVRPPAEEMAAHGAITSFRQARGTASFHPRFIAETKIKALIAPRPALAGPWPRHALGEATSFCRR